MIAQKLIVLSGLPGSGKSTLAEGISRSLSVPVFSVDPIEAAMWRGGLARAQTGVAAYDVAVTLVDEHLRLGHSVIVDAVNPVEAPRAAWRNLAAAGRPIPDRVDQGERLIGLINVRSELAVHAADVGLLEIDEFASLLG